MCKPNNFITVAESAALLETTETRILMMLKNNQLQGKYENDVWYVDKISLGLCNKPKPADIIKSSECCGCGSQCRGN